GEPQPGKQRANRRRACNATMKGVAKRPDRCLRVNCKLLCWLSLMVGLAGLPLPFEADAQNLKSDSALLADQSFALLHKLSKQANNKTALLGLIAPFSGEAESLHQALTRDDLRSASFKITSLQTDREAVDQALKLNPDAASAREWTSMRRQLDKLAS